VPRCGAIRRMGGTLTEGGSNLGSSVAPAGGAGGAPSVDPPGPQWPRTNAAAPAGARPRANVNCLISCSHLSSSMISSSVCPRARKSSRRLFISNVPVAAVQRGLRFLNVPTGMVQWGFQFPNWLWSIVVVQGRSEKTTGLLTLHNQTQSDFFL
jgi:hypothetical protein